MATLSLAILIGMICGACGFWLRQHTKLTVVEVSALLALTAGLILPRVFEEGALFATICTAISYATMCSPQRISSYGQMVVISAICVLLNYYAQGVLVGMGGRLGTSAATSVLIFCLGKSLIVPTAEKTLIADPIKGVKK